MADLGEIVTFSGIIFKPLDPNPDLIDIRDIAHSLSNQCRFTGHSIFHYSVAQHSIYVSDITPQEHKMWGLLHDSSEAFLSDIARPIKNQKELGEIYKRVERRLSKAVADKFDLEWPIPESVLHADDVLLRTEQRDLMPNLLRLQGSIYFGKIIEKWTPEEAEGRFLGRYYELKEKNGK